MDSLAAPLYAKSPWELRLQAGELMIHQQDIRRPLGIPHEIPSDRLVAVLHTCLGRVDGLIIGVKRHARGLTLFATDIDWQWGAADNIVGVISAIVLINAEVDRIPEVAQAIAELDGVSEVYSVAGDADLIAMIRVKEHEQLNDVIADQLNKVQGVIGHQHPHRVPHLLPARPRGGLQPRPRRGLTAHSATVVRHRPLLAGLPRPHGRSEYQRHPRHPC